MAFVDRGSYRLGGTSKLKMDGGARDALRTLVLERAVRPAADAAAQRLNGVSSWGGYVAIHGRAVSWVSALSAGTDSERARRMLTVVNQSGGVL